MRVDVSELMSDEDLGGTTFTRRRPTTTLANYGMASTTYNDITSIPGIIQPANTKDAQYLPEGTRLSDVQAFFTASTDLSPGDGKSELPDLLIDDAGNQYRVLHVQAFDKHGMIRALAQQLFPETLPVPSVTP
jgi:hypothetical protein